MGTMARLDRLCMHSVCVKWSPVGKDFIAVQPRTWPGALGEVVQKLGAEELTCSLRTEAHDVHYFQAADGPLCLTFVDGSEIEHMVTFAPEASTTEIVSLVLPIRADVFTFRFAEHRAIHWQGENCTT